MSHKTKIPNFLLMKMQCMKCEGALMLSEKGDLVCESCQMNYPFVEPGYFNFMPAEATASSMKQDSSDIWDAHWRKISHLDKFMPSQEIDYFNEALPEAFQGRIVLDVGCGSGRNLEKYLKEHPTALVMIDISDSLVIAINKWIQIKDNYKDVELVFIRCDLHRLPFKPNGGIPIVYTSCGVFNIFKDQGVCIKEAMRFSQYIFILFNSPKNIFGRIYYSLNPIRIIMRKIIPFGIFRYLFAEIFSYSSYPFIKVFIYMFNKEISKSFRRETLNFLIYDWLFDSPQGIVYDERYYLDMVADSFESQILEKVISRIIFYKCK